MAVGCRHRLSAVVRGGMSQCGGLKAFVRATWYKKNRVVCRVLKHKSSLSALFCATKFVCSPEVGKQRSIHTQNAQSIDRDLVQRWWKSTRMITKHSCRELWRQCRKLKSFVTFLKARQEVQCSLSPGPVGLCVCGDEKITP